MNNKNATKRGYLNDNFRLFHLKDSQAQTIDYHYHEFSKVILFLSGNVTYMVEGKTYQLKPWDLLFVHHHEIHRSIIMPDEPYERYILWINREFLEQSYLKSFDLNRCFLTTMETRNNLLRTNTKQRLSLVQLLNDLETTLITKDYGNELYSYTLFLQIMITLNRLCINSSSIDIASSVQSNATVDQMIHYIQQNLSKDLSIEALANDLFLSPSYLMHLFKETTGTSLHSYITKKRLSYAVDLLREGVPATLASTQSGYTDYSTFLRNFRKVYHCTPKEYMSQNQTISLFPKKELRE